MRQIRSRPPLPAPTPRLHLDRDVIGTPNEVAAQVALARRSGRLVAMTEPLETRDGRVWVTVRVLASKPAVSPTRRRLRWQVVVPVTVGATAVLAGLAWAVVQLVDAITANAPTIAAALLLAVLLLAVLVRRGHVCTGLHCPGCKG